MSTAHPVPRAPAPWSLSAETYLLPLRLAALPEGVYDKLEESWGSEDFGRWEGGVGAVMVVRYVGTPVGSDVVKGKESTTPPQTNNPHLGPYDELMLIPGNFSVPIPPATPFKIPPRALRIARIYVSQRTTTYNGRLNWNIPKHLARFSFSAPATPPGASPPPNLTIRVFPPGSVDGDGIQPFFHCTLTPWRWVPAIPFNMRWSPLSLVHVQPPIPEPAGHKSAAESEVEARERGVQIDPYDISAKNEVAVAVGTERWCMFDIGGRVKKARGCWVQGVDVERGDEGYWPRGVGTWRVGVWCEGAVLEIGEPAVWKL
ncbi:hypothetical protein SVAN01_03563 [Stagonosporopsis vannaccii]|nr:hypothetical protein SVAN01_03563 [Stagonosporopsis vannaccii]